MAKLPGANTFANFFSEPQHYPSDGYVFAAKNQAMLFNQELAIEYFVNWLVDEWQWIPRDNRKYVFHEVRKHITDGFVKWHGGIDEDGNMGNTWWLYHEWKGNQKGFRHVWVVDFEKHYVQHGHHFDPIISSWGMARSGHTDCVVCGRLKLAQLQGKIVEAETARMNFLPNPTQNYPDPVEHMDKHISNLKEELGHYDDYK